jgi:hypothetical protein
MTHEQIPAQISRLRTRAAELAAKLRTGTLTGINKRLTELEMDICDEDADKLELELANPPKFRNVAQFFEQLRAEGKMKFYAEGILITNKGE